MEGGLRGRGIADDKANVIAHLGMLRAYGGRPPVGVKIVFEGQEEYGSPFDAYPPTEPERFACDAMVIADLGNLRPGTHSDHRVAPAFAPLADLAGVCRAVVVNTWQTASGWMNLPTPICGCTAPGAGCG
ncbi:M20/M25/M40 family metallo-hydrolase [Streptomyces broussonetiae]|uniref:M20/M25/M40 family metallo-hydrolase n=1 Tax=Streptomyces broussonetiae TaxID=2686304 RepID=UPI002D7EF00A|nr:M20/M25/M40 family metallo-hydrolase [Streptomyces broussonetiae]